MVACLLSAAGMLAGASPAFAHEELLSADPSDGANLAQPPASIRLEFSAELDPAFVSTTVTSQDGRRWDAGPPQVEGRIVTVSAQTAVPAGSYTVGYRVVSNDGHPISGGVTYQVTTDNSPAAPAAAAPSTTPASTAPSTAQPPTQGGGMPIWPWLLAAVVVIAIAATVVVRRLGR
ncbi:copper resistance protein CopC [Pseudonocardia sp. RS010]|uniref:copper resistance CopC family protein n=1 Tax=Pseudonocardia sp. RS010 TaxID=3385979 RepID=UPI0039A176B3